MPSAFSASSIRSVSSAARHIDQRRRALRQCRQQQHAIEMLFDPRQRNGPCGMGRGL